MKFAHRVMTALVEALSQTPNRGQVNGGAHPMSSLAAARPFKLALYRETWF